jgi:hypothetical protein
MDLRTKFTWKAALVPAAALTTAFAVGIGYFAGSSPQDTETPEKTAEVSFSSGPNYAPGSDPMARVSQPRASSIEMFRQVNKNYSSDSAGGAAAFKPAVKPKTQAEMQEFLRQVRHDINYEAPASETGAGQAGGSQPGERRIYNPAGLGSKPGPAGISSASLPRLKPSGGPAGDLGNKRSGFGANFQDYGAAPALHGPAAARQQHADDLAATGGGSHLQAGEYGSARNSQEGAGGTGMTSGGSGGSQGGGGDSSSMSSAGGMKQTQTQAGPPPAPIAYLWPRALDFGNMRSYETATRLAILMNIGDLPLSVGAIENIDDSAPFAIEKDNCSNSTLAPGKSCTFLARFSPQGAREYITAFYVPTNDEGSAYYQTYMEIKGKAASSQWTSWWNQHWGGSGQGTVNKAEFGMVPEGRSLSQTVRVTNTGGNNWHAVKLDLSKLPSSFKVTGDGCTGSSVAPGQSCPVTVTFTPTEAVNRKFADSHYGQYFAVNANTGAKVHDPRPKFPPLLLDAPVEAAPKGTFKVLASYEEEYYTTHQEVLEVPLEARSCAPFPVQGLTRVQAYYYFK